MHVEDSTKPSEDKPLTVNVKLAPTLAEGLMKLCEYEGRSKVGIFRWLLRKEMRTHEVFRSADRS